MKVKAKILTIGLLSVIIVVAFCTSKAGKIQSGLSSPPEVQAKKATAFLNSIGVNSAISKRGETLAKTAGAINYTGARWIRTGYEGNIPVQDLVSLHKQSGVKFSYGLLSGGTDIPRLLQGGRQLAAGNCLLAFEGPNEPNNWGVTYNGEQGGKNVTWLPVANLQRDMYAAVKADATLKNYPVWSLSENGAQTNNVGLQYLTIPTGAGTLMPGGTRYADYANCHNYITHPSWPGLHDNQTWIAASPGTDTRVDGLFGNYGHTWGRKFAGYAENELQTLPRVTTETGLTIGDGVTEEQHARLLLTMYLAQFARGCSYTAVYLLRDRSDEQGNQQFGFYKTDYTPRKAAVYLHNLTTILADNSTITQPGTLRYEIVNQPATVHGLLLQKSDGRFELVVWDEKLQGTDNIEINFGTAYSKVTVYDPTKATAPVQTLQNARTIKLALTNCALVVEIAKP